MPAEWEDYDNRSFLRCGPGEVSVACDPATDKWCAFAFDQPILDAENREAAKSAAEAEARRVLMQGLRELGGAEASWRALVDKALGYLHNDNCHDAIPLLVEALDNG
jgi:hypothetical protein